MNQQPQGTVIHQNPNLLQTPATITQLGAPLGQQVPTPNAPILQPPPQYGPPYAQPPAFIQAAVPPPTFLPQQAPPIINYVQTPPQFPSGFQSFPYQVSYLFIEKYIFHLFMKLTNLIIYYKDSYSDNVNNISFDPFIIILGCQKVSRTRHYFNFLRQTYVNITNMSAVVFTTIYNSYI